MVGTPHECQLLAEQEHVEGIAIARTGRLKYLKLTVDTRKALKALRRKLYATGRTVAEASQLISRSNVPGGGVVYTHIVKRIAAYEPALRRGQHPTYAALADRVDLEPADDVVETIAREKFAEELALVRKAAAAADAGFEAFRRASRIGAATIICPRRPLARRGHLSRTRRDSSRHSPTSTAPPPWRSPIRLKAARRQRAATISRRWTTASPAWPSSKPP
jgi:hypothetical protein